MNIDQRISNLERNISTAVPGHNTLGRIELINTTSVQSVATGGSSVTVGNATGTTAWTVVENLGGIFTVSLGRVTCSKAGRYAVWGNVRWDTNTTNRRLLTITKNAGVSSVDLTGLIMQAVTSTRLAVAATSIRLAASDTLELMVFQDSGTARTLAATSTTPQNFVIEYLGA